MQRRFPVLWKRLLGHSLSLFLTGSGRCILRFRTRCFIGEIYRVLGAISETEKYLYFRFISRSRQTICDLLRTGLPARKPLGAVRLVGFEPHSTSISRFAPK